MPTGKCLGHPGSTCMRGMQGHCLWREARCGQQWVGLQEVGVIFLEARVEQGEVLAAQEPTAWVWQGRSAGRIWLHV